jgi:hypothetical protein
MKSHQVLVATCLAACSAFAQTAVNYSDAVGEIAPGVGNHPHLDIASVDVTVDAPGTGITFKLNLSGNPVATDWGKYMIGIRSNPGGATTGNGWGRPINMAGGMTHWVASWVDGGNGGEVWSRGIGWSNTGPAPTVTKDTSSVTIATTTAALGLTPGEVFSFDVYSSGGGGGDSAVDALSAAASSVSGWGGPYTTDPAGGTPNPARSFTMPGTADFATWIAGYGLTGNDALPGTDFDIDGLTNQQEFDLDIGLDPTDIDTDGDDLKDGVETRDGIYDSPTDTGSNPMVFDTDGDGFYDGQEVDGSLGNVRNPNIYNHAKIVVPGTFNTPNAWDPAGVSSPSNEMTNGGTSLTGQYQWSLDQRFAVPKATITHKLTAGSWGINWGAGPVAGVAVRNGGDINRVIAASGIHRITFNSGTLAYTFTRPTFADLAAFMAAYGLVNPIDDLDGDGLSNEAEFGKNTDPDNADTDGDTQNDSVDLAPLEAAAESREIVFQVNMTVATSSSYFTPGSSVVRVIGQFNGWSINTGVVLSDPNADGIYTGSYTAEGFAGLAFGGYKFFIDGGPNGGYETSADRNFNLGTSGVQQVIPAVYFSNIQPPAGFNAWILNYPGLLDTSRGGDPDGDGATNEEEFLFGTSPASGSERPVTASAGPAGLTLVWLQRATGASYVLEENNDLAGAWTPGPVVPAASGDQSGVPADYVRMTAVVPIAGSRNFVRVNGTEN